MSKNTRKHITGRKVAVMIVIVATLFISLAGSHLSHTHAASLDESPSADSLPTNAPNTCLFWEGVQSQLSGAAPIDFIDIPNVGSIEIDDTVYANGCSEVGASNLIMSGLVYVHWTSGAGIGNPPPMTVTLQSEATAHAVNATWNLSLGANAGGSAGTGSNPALDAGASANFNFTISPNDSTIVDSTATITNQQSAYFSYQNLSATASTAINGQVTQVDDITISIEGNAQYRKFENIVTPFFW